MDEYELIDFLKSRLSVRIDSRSAGYGSGVNDKKITVELLLDGQVISYDTISITEGESKGYY